MTVLLVEGSGSLATNELSIGAGSLPRVEVRLISAALPVGVSWTLTGSTADGFTWPVRGGSGIGAGQQVVLVDNLAPVNVLLTYTLTVAGEVTWSGTIVRPFTGTGGDGFGADGVADLIGSKVATVRRLPGDDRGSERRFHTSRVAGSRTAPYRVDPTAGVGTVSLAFASVGADTAALRSWARDGLLDSSDPVAFYHDTSRCQLPGCPVPPVELGLVTAERSGIGERIDVGERQWDVTYLVVADPEPNFVAPFQTWDDFDAAGLTWDEIDSLGLTWDEWDATTWSEVGG